LIPGGFRAPLQNNLGASEANHEGGARSDELPEPLRREDALGINMDLLSRPFRLDTLNEQIRRDDALIALRLRPFAMLRYLTEHPGRLITHDEMRKAIWPSTYVSAGVLRVYLREVRTALDDAAESPKFIETIPRRGYRFIPQVERRLVPTGDAASPRRIILLLRSPTWSGATAKSAAFRSRQTREGLDAIDDAFKFVNSKDEHAWEPELLRLKGELLLEQFRHGQGAKGAKRGDNDAEECLVAARELARVHGSRKWELRAAQSLSNLYRHQRRRKEARQVLSDSYRRFREGFETVELKAAKQTLDKLGADPR
jgi:DNA-binding winged helix-turn-helix (wHTH) protein